MADEPRIRDTESLRQALGQDPDLRDLARCIDDIQRAVGDIWEKDYQPWFTDHGPDHSRRVAAYAVQLSLLPMLHASQWLSALEVFVLWAAAWLHDIGMQDLMSADAPLGEIQADGFARVRHLHPDRSSDKVLEDWSELGLPAGDSSLAETIAGVARAHGTKYYKDTVTNRLNSVVRVRNKNIRARLLAALLLFADELDLHYQRVQPLPGWVQNNAVSEAHSFKHSCVESVQPVCEPDGRIAVELQLAFPQDMPEEHRQLIQRWIEVKLMKQMGMVETEVLEGFSSQARFDRVIRTQVRTRLAAMPPVSDAALAVIRADTTRDELVNHEVTLDKVRQEIDDNGIVVVLPRQPGLQVVANDGQTDLIDAVAAAVAVEGRRVCVSRLPSLVLGATAVDVLNDWLRCVEPETVDSEVEGTSSQTALDRLVGVLSSRSDEAYLFVILGAEYLEQADLGWIASFAVPTMRGSASCAFALTGGTDRFVLVPDAAVTTVVMSDLSQRDVAEYLGRFVGEDVALAESRTLESYDRVKLQAQQHVIARRK